MTDHPLFRLSPAHGLKDDGVAVDRTDNVIRGAAINQQGRLSELSGDDRRWANDEVTHQQIIAFGNRPNRGVKARFAHPSMSDDGLGKFLGRWRNFRQDGDVVRADLHISDTAFDTPTGDLGAYVLDLAEEDPEAFGVSIAPRLDRESMEETRDEDGFESVRIHKLFAVDVVDEPAGTAGGFFSLEHHDPAALAQLTSWVIDQHFPEATPGELQRRFSSLLARYFSAKGIQMTDNQDAALANVDREECEDLSTEIDALAPVSQSNDEGVRVKKILASCELAGVSLTQAREWADSDMSVSDVKDALIAYQATKNVPPAGEGDDPLSTPDPDKGLREEWQTLRDAGMELSFERFKKQREIDNNGGVLQTPMRIK